MKRDLSVEVCGRNFKNPVLIASATPSRDSKFIRKCVDYGVGGIVAKTVTSEPGLQKNVSPRFTILHKKGWPYAFSNYSCESLANYTPEAWAEELSEAAKYCHAHNTRLIGSIYGRNLQNWQYMAEKMAGTGVDMMELNFGYASMRYTGCENNAEPGNNPDLAYQIAQKVAGCIDIPVFVKLNAEGVSPVVMARKMQEAGVSGVTIMNRIPALEIDIETGRPLLHASLAGVGGPWMRPLILKWVAKVAREVDIPISATGGIWEWQDLVKNIMVGASTVQICTALMYSNMGMRKIEEFIDGLSAFMERKGYSSICDFKGISLGQIVSWDKVDRQSRAVSEVNPLRCSGCGMCKNWCLYDAISFKNRSAVIDSSKCEGCGLCVSLCLDNAISMHGHDSIFLGDFS